MGRIVRTGMAAVLNANDIDTRRAAPYTPASCSPTRHRSRCRAPIRWHAPRAPGDGRAPHGRLYPAPAALQGAVVAIVLHDTRGIALSDAQRLSHFPATPLVCVSWYRDLDVGFVENTADAVAPLRCRRDAVGQPFGPYRGRRRADGSA